MFFNSPPQIPDMEEEELDRFRQAGKIASKIREESKSLIMVDASYIDIAETVEQMIIEEGAKPAFPVNISVNEIAAHYTPEAGSEETLKEKDIVKIDLGVELSGALADTAYTVDLSEEHEDLVKASENALEAAIAAMKPNLALGELGGIIEETIKKDGFKPIANLTGHMIKSNDLHAGVEIPNIKTDDDFYLMEGDVYAVEPFATTGGGYVVDLNQVEIYSLYSPGKIRMRQSRKIVDYVLKNFGMLPFAERWIRREFQSKVLVSAAIKELLKNHFIRAYPVLRESDNGLVSQAEHTVFITEDGVEVLTK
jgi:methionyl aminopeptidase